MNQDSTTKKATQKSKGFTDEEKAAMKERAKELKPRSKKLARGQTRSGYRSISW